MSQLHTRKSFLAHILGFFATVGALPRLLGCAGGHRPGRCGADGGFRRPPGAARHPPRGLRPRRTSPRKPPIHASKLFPKSGQPTAHASSVAFLFVAGTVVAAGITYYATNKYANVGYGPVQPVPYSRISCIRASLGIDCRYCHSNVEKSGFSNVPTAQTCMNCHTQVKKDSPLLAVVRKELHETGAPVPWVQIHALPDYVYFNHSVHVTRGVSCVECHGRIDTMDVVAQQKPLSMSFCLNCHRDPEAHLRDPKLVTDLAWSAGSEAEQREIGAKYVKLWNVKPPQSCSGCHR